MSGRQRQKRQDDTNARTQASPVAEAIAIGTAAGGLVIGTMQALGTETADPPERDAGPSLDHHGSGAVTPAVATDARSASSGSAPVVDQASAAVQPVAIDAATLPPSETPSPAQAEGVPNALTVAEATPAPASGGENVVASTIPMPVQTQLVTELSEQISATLNRVIGSVDGGQSRSDLAQSLASDIVQSAQDIVARIDIGQVLDVAPLPTGIAQAVDVQGIVDAALGATEGLADSVLAQVADLPASLLGQVNSELADLPSALLGNDGPEDTGGLLSTLFYPDGGSDGLAIPDLSDAADSLVADLGSTTLGMLGISYVDMPDVRDGSPGLGLN